MAKKDKSRKSLKTYLKFELYGILIIITSVITIAESGSVGRSIAYLFKFLAGTWNFIFPLLGIVLGLAVMIKRGWPAFWNTRLLGVYLLFTAFLMIAHIPLVGALTADGTFEDLSIIPKTWDLLIDSMQDRTPVGGGMLGGIAYAIFYFLFGQWGIRVAITALILAGFLLLTGLSYIQMLDKVRAMFKLLGSHTKNRLKDFIYLLSDQTERFSTNWFKKKTITSKKGEELLIVDFKDQLESEPEVPLDIAKQPVKPIVYDFEANREEPDGQAADQELKHKTDPSEEHTPLELELIGAEPEATNMENIAPYTLPPFSLLDKPKGGGKSGEHRDITANAKKLEATLESFGVRARVTQIHRGPAVTRYEVQPDTGVKVSRIVNLTDDLALALAAKDIRIEAPIPGKAAVGIEVPNSEVAVVTLREVLESSAFHEAPSKLSIALGRDISGEPIVGNLAKMPHLLVAGATGSGKSVCINGIIASVLYKAKPNEVKFLMVDPKMVELNVYNGIPHLLAPVVTDPRRASMALKKVVQEMEKRYELFAKSGTRDIERYNAALAAKNDPASPPLPYIIVIVDELAA